MKSTLQTIATNIQFIEIHILYINHVLIIILLLLYCIMYYAVR